MPLDATRLLPRLHIGGVPSSAEAVQRAGFGLLVLCAAEIQPPDAALGTLRTLRCPLVDDPTVQMPQADWARAVKTAERVCREMLAGRSALVTCAQGINRSAMVCAIVLHLLTFQPAEEVIHHVRRRRQGALRNPQFVRALTRGLRR